MAEQARIISYEDASRASFVARREAAKRPQRKSVNPKDVVKTEVEAVSAKASAKAAAKQQKAAQRAAARAAVAQETQVAQAEAVQEDPEARRARVLEASANRRRAKAAAAESRKGFSLAAAWDAVYNRLHVLLQKPAFVTALCFFGILLAVGVFLMPTAGNYYRAMREEARAQAEYDAVIERNQQLKDRVEALATDEGVIQEAREQGMIEEGEHAVSVYGGTKESTDVVNSEVVSGTVKAPTTWYSPVLDLIFGVE